MFGMNSSDTTFAILIICITLYHAWREFVQHFWPTPAAEDDDD